MSKFQQYGIARARVKRLIQKSLDDLGYSMVDVSRLAGVTRQSVSQTLNGYIHSEKVLSVLRSIGIDEGLLFDPRNNKAA